MSLSSIKDVFHICKNCKFWNTETTDFGTDGHYGECICGKFVSVGRGRPGVVFRDFLQFPPFDELRYWDYKGGETNVRVGENFGCIYWEKK